MKEQIYLKKYEDKDGVRYAAKYDEAGNYVTAKKLGDAELSLSTKGVDPQILQAKEGKYGKYWIGEVLGQEYFINDIVEGKFGPYLKMKQAGEKPAQTNVDGAEVAERPETYGAR